MSETVYWRMVEADRNELRSFYSVLTPCRTPGMDALRELFPEAKADSLNFCIFSTSGVHGSYRTLEDAEECLNRGLCYEDGEPDENEVTFLVIHPRTVCMRSGNVRVRSREDLDFLYELRRTSLDVVCKIAA